MEIELDNDIEVVAVKHAGRELVGSKDVDRRKLTSAGVPSGLRRMQPTAAAG